MASDKYCLRWNDFETNVSHAFNDLRQEKELLDVTLACEEDQVMAHKVILSACSSFFRSILKRNPHQHPLLYLKGVRYSDLVSVLNFMYQGEVNVAQDNLNTFLSVAEELQIKGLTQNNTEKDVYKNSCDNYNNKLSNSGKSERRKDVNKICVPSSPVQINSDSEDLVHVKTEGGEQQHHQAAALATTDPGQIVEDYSADGDYNHFVEDGFDMGQSLMSGGTDGNQALDTLIADAMSRDPETKEWKCNYCAKSHKDKARIKRHVEVHFPGHTQLCPYCQKECNSRNSLRVHISDYHKHIHNNLIINNL